MFAYLSPYDDHTMIPSGGSYLGSAEELHTKTTTFLVRLSTPPSPLGWPRKTKQFGLKNQNRIQFLIILQQNQLCTMRWLFHHQRAEFEINLLNGVYIGCSREKLNNEF